jgi:iron complex outermembrane receptor protein
VSAVAVQATAQGMLEEVVVTAQKRSENLQDVPVSVSAIAGADIEMFRFRDGTDIAAQIPNLQATNTAGDGFPIFSLRGVAMSDYSFNQSSPVATYIDEVYKGNPAIQGAQLFDLERIEVLRGPQGTLYGKNSTGGAVNYITRTPGYGETSGNLTLGYGNFNRREISGAVDTPLQGDTLGLRIAGTWTEADGWFDNRNPGIEDGNAIDEYGLRVSLAWQPSDTVEALLRYTKTDQRAVNYGIQPFNISADGLGGGVYGLYNALGATDKVDYQRNGLDFRDFESDQDARRELSNQALALTVNWALNDRYQLTSITSWDDGEALNPEDTDGSPLEVLSIPYYGEAEQYTQDLRLASSGDGPFNFIAGLYWSQEQVYNATTIGFYSDLDMNLDGSIDAFDCADVAGTAFLGAPITEAGLNAEATLNSLGFSLADFAPASCQFDNAFDQERTSQAAYFDGNLALSEAWTLRLGLRYTRDKTELSDFSARILAAADGTPILNTIPGDPVDAFARAGKRSETEGEWTGKLGLDYTSEAGTLIYGNVSHGYRSGAFNAQAFLDPSELTYVEPETLDGAELGVKHEFLQGGVRLNAAAFYYRYDNQQFLNIDGIIQTLVNIDESEIAGMEVEVEAALSPGLIVQAGLGLLSTDVRDGELSGVDLAGNDLLLAPASNFNLAVTWDIATLEQGTFTLRADTSFIDDFYFDVYNTERTASEAYWLHNLRLDFLSTDEGWQLGVWVKNVSDEDYYTSTLDLQTFGFDYGHVGAPRTYGAELRLNF